MPRTGKTLSLRSLKGSHIPGDGSKIEITAGTVTGDSAKIRFTPELAAALIAALSDAYRKASDFRERSGGKPLDGIDTWEISRASVEHRADGVHLDLHSSGVRHAFVMKRAESATLGYDLLGRDAAQKSRASPAAGSATVAVGRPLPSALNLPLVTPPIRTMSMTEYPDGLAVEMRMDMQTPDGSFERVRLPMFADMARDLIEALQQQLERIGEAESSLNPEKPS